MCRKYTIACRAQIPTLCIHLSAQGQQDVKKFDGLLQYVVPVAASAIVITMWSYDLCTKSWKSGLRSRRREVNDVRLVCMTGDDPVVLGLFLAPVILFEGFSVATSIENHCLLLRMFASGNKQGTRSFC